MGGVRVAPWVAPGTPSSSYKLSKVQEVYTSSEMSEGPTCRGVSAWVEKHLEKSVLGDVILWRILSLYFCLPYPWYSSIRILMFEFVIRNKRSKFIPGRRASLFTLLGKITAH